ncbi:recombination mediator RecR [Suttonella ornithocola]|uniref:Recombination protein RecR n=1 Tax=Suttonella ornithocola TaxID=279832 RepID=A0A380MZN7_9GAMM|nr:recombination mediator RecR [Suttonella ornithocola]SUO97728.1 Recombination protein RecR [Suttonella ornithocola]
MTFSKAFEQLVEALTCLSGVGNKTAQRMALELLLKKQTQADILSKAIAHALNTTQQCQRCRNLSDEELCLICRNHSRDQQTLCIVEAPSDVLAIEQSTDFQGQYFVLMGHLSPLDGIGPEALGLDILDRRFAEEEIKEVVLATNSTLEGEATAYFLAELAKKHGISTTRLAHGVPMGGELSYIDKQTLSLAFRTRNRFEIESFD